MSVSLRNHFLIAMPGMEDPNFAHSITYLCEHSDEGAMGLVVNRPLELCYDEIFDHLDIADFPTLALSQEISLTTSRDILEAMARGEGPRDALVALGYAGWGPGQLEREIAGNAWLTLPAEASVLFDVPLERRAHVAALQLGINLDLLSSSCGTA
jgi:putative transcriptional regulator